MCRAFPTVAAESLAQHRLLAPPSRACGARGFIVSGEDEQDERPVVAQGDAPDHAAGLAVEHVDVFVARPIASGLERGDRVTEILFKLLPRPEGELANLRMQAVGADDEVK